MTKLTGSVIQHLPDQKYRKGYLGYQQLYALMCSQQQLAFSSIDYFCGSSHTASLQVICQMSNFELRVK